MGPIVKQLRMLRNSNVILIFSSHITQVLVLVLVQHLSSLSQPVTSHADNNEPLKRLYIEFIREQTIEFNVPRVHSFNLSLKNHWIHDSLGFEYSVCDITVSYPSLLTR